MGKPTPENIGIGITTQAKIYDHSITTSSVTIKKYYGKG
jgi:hypothetical protein